MNQDKLEVVKQEMARVNVDILGISELKRTGMGEFNSDDHYIYYCITTLSHLYVTSLRLYHQRGGPRRVTQGPGVGRSL